MEKEMKVEFVNKQKAKEFLQKNKKNRKLSGQTVNYYSNLMNRGEWMLSPDPIIFDKENNLMNGQHRLSALIMSNVTELEFFVAYGQDQKIFTVLDTGKVRSSADVLGMENYYNSAALGSAAKLLYLYDNGIEDDRIHHTERISNQQVLDTVKSNPLLAQSVDLVQKLRKRNKFLPEPSFVSFLHYIYSESDKEKIDSFVCKLSTGDGLSITDPVFHLRKMLTADLGSKKKLPITEKRAFILYTLNCHMQGKKLTRLRPHINEDGTTKFPEILGFINKKN